MKKTNIVLFAGLLSFALVGHAHLNGAMDATSTERIIKKPPFNEDGPGGEKRKKAAPYNGDGPGIPPRPGTGGGK